MVRRCAPSADEVAEIDVDDPHATRTGQKIPVLRQMRSDPLARLHARKQIDEAQYNAGRAYQRDWRSRNAASVRSTSRASASTAAHRPNP